MEEISNVTEKVEKLKELYDAGIITQKEFKKKKKQLLKVKKKKTPLKILGTIFCIPIVFVLVITIIISISTYVEMTEFAKIEEQFAIDYLLEFSSTFKNPHSIKLHKVWVYTDSSNQFYVAYNLSATNTFGAEMEGTYGNNSGVLYFDTVTREKSIEAIDKAKFRYLLDVGEYWKKSNYLEAVENGRTLNAEKIQKSFEEEL